MPKGSLTQLGAKVGIASSPDQATIESIPVEDSSVKDAVCRFSCPEFTSLCPVTGQPDFARIYIDYIPEKFLIESKSLKLYLASFRNHGAFHEVVTVGIAKRLVESVTPRWLRIYGIWMPRGGIPIDIFWQTSQPPNNIFVPPLKLFPYEGR